MVSPQNPAIVTGGLPQIIPTQQTPLGRANADGSVIIDINWWLFLYNTSSQVLALSSGGIPISPTDVMEFNDADIATINALQDARSITNLQILISDQIVPERTNLKSSVTGILPVANGGTGLAAWTLNGVLYASTTATIAQSANLTFDGTTLSVTGAVVVSHPANAVVGSVTLNQCAGRVILAALGTTLTLTNSFIVATSIIHLTFAGNPGVTTALYAVAGAGSATINVTAALVNQTAINFWVNP